MRTTIKAALAFIAALLLLAPSAAAKTYQHVKSGVDWSTSSACGRVNTTANIEINNYRVYAGRQAYSIDMDGDTATTPDVTTYAVYIDGVKQSGTQTFTVYFNDENVHTIKGVWSFVFCRPSRTVTL